MLGTGNPLLDDMLHGGFASNGFLGTMFALVMGIAAKEVGSFHGWFESVLLHEVDIGLGTGGLVIGVVNELDSGHMTGLACLFGAV